MSASFYRTASHVSLGVAAVAAFIFVYSLLDAKTSPLKFEFGVTVQQKPVKDKTGEEILQMIRSGSDAPAMFLMTIDEKSPYNALYKVNDQYYLHLEIPELVGYSDEIALQFVNIRTNEPRSFVFVNKPNRKLIRELSGITVVFSPEIKREDLHGKDVFVGIVAATTPVSSFVLGVEIAADGSGLKYIKPNRP